MTKTLFITTKPELRFFSVSGFAPFVTQLVLPRRLFLFSLLLCLIPGFAVWTFEHIFSFSEGNQRKNEKKRNVVSAAFLDELPEKAAAVAAVRFGGSL
jgi:hypothetical protein